MLCVLSDAMMEVNFFFFWILVIIVADDDLFFCSTFTVTR